MLLTKVRPLRRGKALLRSVPPRALKSPAGPVVCSRCKAVWRKGAWSLDPSVQSEVNRWATPAFVVCPACRLTAERNPNGILYLDGEFLRTRREGILHLLTNTERVAATKNPMARVIRTQELSAGQLVVEVTSEKLARRLGRAVNRAYGGTLRIRFSHEDKLVRVYWRRDSLGSVA